MSWLPGTAFAQTAATGDCRAATVQYTDDLLQALNAARSKRSSFTFALKLVPIELQLKSLKGSLQGDRSSASDCQRIAAQIGVEHGRLAKLIPDLQVAPPAPPPLAAIAAPSALASELPAAVSTLGHSCAADNEQTRADLAQRFVQFMQIARLPNTGLSPYQGFSRRLTALDTNMATRPDDCADHRAALAQANTELQQLMAMEARMAPPQESATRPEPQAASKGNSGKNQTTAPASTGTSDSLSLNVDPRTPNFSRLSELQQNALQWQAYLHFVNPDVNRGGMHLATAAQIRGKTQQQLGEELSALQQAYITDYLQKVGKVSKQAHEIADRLAVEKLKTMPVNPVAFDRWRTAYLENDAKRGPEYIEISVRQYTSRMKAETEARASIAKDSDGKPIKPKHYDNIKSGRMSLDRTYLPQDMIDKIFQYSAATTEGCSFKAGIYQNLDADGKLVHTNQTTLDDCKAQPKNAVASKTAPDSK